MPKTNLTMSPSATEAMRQLGLAIRAARKDQRMTQKALAARANVSPRTIRLLEAGGETVTLGTLASVLDVLGMAHHLAALPATDDNTKRTDGVTKRPATGFLDPDF